MRSPLIFARDDEDENAEMTTVFIAGSAGCRVSTPRRAPYRPITEKGFIVLVGDRQRADKAVQRMVVSRDVPVPPGARGFACYDTKEQVMVYGAVVWEPEQRSSTRGGSALYVCRGLSLPRPPVRPFHDRRFRDRRQAHGARVTYHHPQLGVENVEHRFDAFVPKCR